MASYFIFSIFVLFCFTSATEEEADYTEWKPEVSVRMLGKEDVNTSIYQKYMAHLKKKELQKLAAANESNIESLGNLNGTNSTNLNESSSTSPKRPKWYCEGRTMDAEHAGRVLLVNDSALLQWVNSSNNASDGCGIVMFYAQFCPFSASIAPQFNAFGRAYNNTPVLAIDAYKYSSVNARFGVVAVPTILIFHAGKPVLKFNHSKTLEDLRTFVKNYTGLEGNTSVNVTLEDYIGPVSSTSTKETDFYLILSALFVISFGLYLFSQTTYGEQAHVQIQHFIHWTRTLHWFKTKQE